MSYYLESDNNTLSTDSHRREFMGPKYITDQQAGLSKFHLCTVADDGSPVVLVGLLSELPEISFSVSYDKGPGNEWQDTISKFTGNDLMQLVNTLGAAGQSSKNIVAASTWTKKVYSGYSNSNIQLKFRIYSSDTLGQSASYETWFKSLTKYATISHKNIMDARTMINNALEAWDNAETAGEDFAGAVTNFNKILNPSSNMSGDDLSAQNAERYYADVEENRRAIGIFNKACKNVIGNKFKIVWSNGTATLKSVLSEMILSIGDSSKSTTYYLTLHYANDNQNDIVLNKAEVGKGIDKTVSPENYNINNTKPFTLSDIRQALNNLDPDKSDFEKEEDYNDWIKVKNSIFAEMNRLEADNKAISEDSDSFSKNLKLVKALVDNGGDYLVSKFDEYRVVHQFNKENMLGEKLWELHLYEDVIFKKHNPLIVYISDWSMQNSEEFDLNLNEPIYREFTITCVLDQVYSREQWNRILYYPTINSTIDLPETSI